MKFDPEVRLIPVNQIKVLNPRRRAKKKFDQITANIAKLGLKRPVTVSLADSSEGDVRYWLVCGQGRLEAYIALGQDEIPAVFVEGTREELMLMSLTENLARRQHTTIELVRDISRMKDAGCSPAEVARKTDLHVAYVRAILQLLAKGEERLLQAVEKGQLPVSIAIIIATSDDKAVQHALQEAYEKNDLRGKSLLRARSLIENRRANGKKSRRGQRRPERTVSTEDLLKTFQTETIRQKMIIQKAKVQETRLLFAVSAVRQLLQDENFVTLLRAEGLDSLPEYLAEKVGGSGVAA